jgi:glucan phosphoethanolaminetransferase (alkaline phosphatase superfamily)
MAPEPSRDKTETSTAQTRPAPNRNQVVWWSWCLRIIAVCALFRWLNNRFDYMPMVYGLNYLLPKACVYLVALFSLVALLLSRSAWIRWPALVWVVLTCGLQIGFYSATGKGFSLEEAIGMLAATDAAGDCVRLYWKLALPALSALILIGGGVTWALRRYLVEVGPWWSVSSLPALAGALGLAWQTQGFASPFTTPYRVTALLSYVMATRYTGPREQPFFPAPPRESERVPHLVLIVDESVLGCELSINGYPRPTTPFLDKHQGQFWNGGIASSAAIKTEPSNRTVYSGLRFDQFPDTTERMAKNPSLCSYAIQAGYACECLFAQSFRGLVAQDLHVFGPAKLAFTENLNPVEYQREFELISPLEAFLQAHERSFTYINKRGAHFPYALHCPADRRVFGQGASADGSWSFDLRANVNDYDNSLRYVVDEYFSRLSAALEASGKDVLVLYTSDHGQTLPGFLGTNALRATHGYATLPPITANVPLMAFGFGPKGRAFIEKLARNDTLFNNCTHFQIFPTLLRAMGYPAEQVQKLYGPSLLDRLPQPQPRRYVAESGGGKHCELREFPPEQNRIATNLYDAVMHWKALPARGSGVLDLKR